MTGNQTERLHRRYLIEARARLQRANGSCLTGRIKTAVQVWLYEPADDPKVPQPVRDRLAADRAANLQW